MISHPDWLNWLDHFHLALVIHEKQTHWLWHFNNANNANWIHLRSKYWGAEKQARAYLQNRLFDEPK